MSTSPSSYVHRTTQTHSMLSSSNKSMFCLPEYFQVKNIQSHSFVSLFCLVIVDFDKHFIVLSQTMFTFSLNWKRILGYQCHLFNSMLNNILYLFGLYAECLSFVRSLSVEPCLSAMWVPSLVSIMQEEKMCNVHPRRLLGLPSCQSFHKFRWARMCQICGMCFNSYFQVVTKRSLSFC